MSVVATIRPACDGIFGPCVAVEEGTTNIIAVGSVDPDFTNDSNGDGLADGWQVWVESLDSGRAHAMSLVDGVDTGTAQRLEITASSNTNASVLGMVVDSRASVSGGTTYTASAYIRTNHDQVRLYITEYDASGAFVKANTSPYAVGNAEWQRIEYTFMTGSNTVKISARILFGSDIGDWVEVDKYQIEQKSFATSFVDGTRGDGRLYYPLDKVLRNRSAWTIAFWLRPLGVPSNGNTPIFWNIGEYSDPITEDYHYLRVSPAAYPNPLVWLAADRYGFSQSLSSTTQIQVGQDYLITIVWDKSGTNKRYLYVNGSLEASADTTSFSNVVLCTGRPEFWVGFYNVSAYPPNALYSNLLVLPYAVDSNTVKEWYDLRKPFFDPSPRIVVPRPSSVSLSVA